MMKKIAFAYASLLYVLTCLSFPVEAVLPFLSEMESPRLCDAYEKPIKILENPFDGSVLALWRMNGQVFAFHKQDAGQWQAVTPDNLAGILKTFQRDTFIPTGTLFQKFEGLTDHLAQQDVRYEDYSYSYYDEEEFPLENQNGTPIPNQPQSIQQTLVSQNFVGSDPNSNPVSTVANISFSEPVQEEEEEVSEYEDSQFLADISALLSPSRVRGYQTQNQFSTQTDLINVITWQSPREGNRPVAYAIYRSSSLSSRSLLKIVPSHHRLHFHDHQRRRSHTYVYYLVSIDRDGTESQPVQVLFRGSQVEIHCDSYPLL